MINVTKTGEVQKKQSLSRTVIDAENKKAKYVPRIAAGSKEER
jgi:hypothetical protein